MLYEAMLLFIVTLSTTIIMMSVSSYSYCGLSFECECGAWFFSWFVFGADLSDFARGSSEDFRFFDGELYEFPRCVELDFRTSPIMSLYVKCWIFPLFCSIIIIDVVVVVMGSIEAMFQN